MTTPVIFPIAKLLKEKGFYIDKSDTLKFYHDENTLRKWDGLLRIGICPQTPKFDYSKIDIYQAPTIAEIVMWLFEKHKTWISVEQNSFIGGGKSSFISNVERTEYNSPTEAYEAAIEYTLKNLI